MGPATQENMKIGAGKEGEAGTGTSTVEASKSGEAVVVASVPVDSKKEGGGKSVAAQAPAPASASAPAPAPASPGAAAAKSDDEMQVKAPSGATESSAAVTPTEVDGGTEKGTSPTPTATAKDGADHVGHKEKKRVLVPVAPGSEDIEFMCICDTLARFGAKVVVAGVGASDTGATGPVCLSQGLRVIPDCSVDNAAKEDWDCIVLPGAMAGATAMKESQVLVKLLKRHRDTGRLLGAICASPAVVLVPLSLLQRKGGKGIGQATCYPANSLMGRIRNAIGPDGLSEDNVAYWDDRTVITSQGPGTALEFALRIGEELYGPQEASRVQSELLVVLSSSSSDTCPPVQPPPSEHPSSRTEMKIDAEPTEMKVDAEPTKEVRRKRAASSEPTKRRCPTSPSQAQLFSLIIWPVLERLGWKFESERTRGTDSSDERTLLYFPPGVPPRRPYSRMKRNVDCYHGRDAVVNLLSDLSFSAEPMDTDEPGSSAKGSAKNSQYTPSDGDKSEYRSSFRLYEDCLRVENDRAAMGKLPRGYSAQWLIQEATRFPISEAPLFDHVIWPTLECLGWTCTSVLLNGRGRMSDVSKGPSSRSITSSIIDGEEHDPRPSSESKRRRRLYVAPASPGEKGKIVEDSDLSLAASLASSQRNLFDTRQQVLDFLEHDAGEWGSRVEVLRCRDVYNSSMTVARELKREGQLPVQSCVLSKTSAEWLVAETRRRRPILADIPKPVNSKDDSSDEGDEVVDTGVQGDEDDKVDTKPKKKAKNETPSTKKPRTGAKKGDDGEVSKKDEVTEDAPSAKLRKRQKEDSRKEAEEKAPLLKSSPAPRERKSKSLSPGEHKEVVNTTPRRASAGARRSSTPTKTDAVLFNRLIWPVLESKGWTLEAGNRPTDSYYMPPGVSRKSGARCRKDFFDSLRQVQQVVEDRKEWNSLPEVQRSLKKYHACVLLKNNSRAMKELPKGHDFETFLAKAESLAEDN